MYKATIMDTDGKEVIRLISENRTWMRTLSAICEKNSYVCWVEEEIPPRIVKFKTT